MLYYSRLICFYFSFVITFVVNKNITIKAVPEEKDIFIGFEVDVCSGE